MKLDGESKRCGNGRNKGCGETKPRSDFYIYNGVAARDCKECTRSAQKAKYVKTGGALNEIREREMRIEKVIAELEPLVVELLQDMNLERFKLYIWHLESKAREWVN